MLIFCFLATEGPAGRPLPWARLSIESKPRAPSKRHPPRRPAWTLWRRKISSHLPSWSTKHASKQSKEKKKKKTRYVIFILNHFFISLNGNNRYIRWPIVHCTIRTDRCIHYSKTILSNLSAIVQLMYMYEISRFDSNVYVCILYLSYHVSY